MPSGLKKDSFVEDEPEVYELENRNTSLQESRYRFAQRNNVPEIEHFFLSFQRNI